MTVPVSISVAKNQAKTLKDYLKQANAGISHSACLHAIAKIHGYKDWNTMSALMENVGDNSVSDYKPASMYDIVKISNPALIVLMNGGRSGNLDLNCYKILSFMLHEIEENSVSLRDRKHIMSSLPTRLNKNDFDHAFDLLLESGFVLERRGVSFINPNWFWKGDDSNTQKAFLKQLHDSEKADDDFVTNYDYAKHVIERFSSVDLPLNTQFEFDHFGMNRVVVTLDKWLSNFDISFPGSSEPIELDDKKNWLREDIDEEAEKIFTQTWFREGFNSQWLSSGDDEGYMVEYFIDINHPLMKESLDLVIKRLLSRSD